MTETVSDQEQQSAYISHSCAHPRQEHPPSSPPSSPSYFRVPSTYFTPSGVSLRRLILDLALRVFTPCCCHGSLSPSRQNTVLRASLKTWQELILLFLLSSPFSFLPLAGFANGYEQKFRTEATWSRRIITLEREERGHHSANGFMDRLERRLIEAAL